MITHKISHNKIAITHFQFSDAGLRPQKSRKSGKVSIQAFCFSKGPKKNLQKDSFYRKTLFQRPALKFIKKIRNSGSGFLSNREILEILISEGLSPMCVLVVRKNSLQQYQTTQHYLEIQTHFSHYVFHFSTIIYFSGM